MWRDLYFNFVSLTFYALRFPSVLVPLLCSFCSSVAFRSVTSCVDDLDESRSLQLKKLLSEYFDQRRERDHTLKPVDLEELNTFQVQHGFLKVIYLFFRKQEHCGSLLSVLQLSEWEDQIRADIRCFLSCRSDEKFSGRAVARVFHGIGEETHPSMRSSHLKYIILLMHLNVCFQSIKLV